MALLNLRAFFMDGSDDPVDGGRPSLRYCPAYGGLPSREWSLTIMEIMCDHPADEYRYNGGGHPVDVG